VTLQGDEIGLVPIADAIKQLKPLDKKLLSLARVMD
jgi:hypothetical protein